MNRKQPKENNEQKSSGDAENATVNGDGGKNSSAKSGPVTPSNGNHAKQYRDVSSPVLSTQQ